MEEFSAHVDFCTLFHYHHILTRLQVRAALLLCETCLLIRAVSARSLRTCMEPGPVLSPGDAVVNRTDEVTPSGSWHSSWGDNKQMRNMIPGSDECCEEQ